MNTPKEKNNDNLYITYVKTICSHCAEKDNDKDLCSIKMTIDGKVKCSNYKRIEKECLVNKCKTCYKEPRCFAKKHKPLMKGF